MKRFHAGLFLGAVRMLEKTADSTLKKADDPMTDEARLAHLRALELHEQEVKDLDLKASLATHRRLIALLSRPTVRWSELGDLSTEFNERLIDEMSTSYFLSLTVGEATLYESVYPFGEEVALAFPSTQFDIEEAAKCLATGRATACVFHLMRVIEVVLRIVAKSLNDASIDPTKNPTWQRILDKFTKELSKPLAQRAPEWANDDTFFAGVAASLMAVKDAWRNPTMHIETVYDFDRAFDVWINTAAFMRHVATKLHE